MKEQVQDDGGGTPGSGYRVLLHLLLLAFPPGLLQDQQPFRFNLF